LLFDNTTVITHHKIKVTSYIKKQKINDGAKEEIKKESWEMDTRIYERKTKGVFLWLATCTAHILCKFNTNLCPLYNELITSLSCYQHVVL